MNFTDYYMNEDKDITKEMEDYFEERTNRHIDLVKKYAKLIEEYDPVKFKGLTEIAEKHDQSKLKDPERIPYIKLTWQHKLDNHKGYKTPGSLPDKEINQATLHHITTNKHHPESHGNKQENKDKSSKEIINATKMPDMYIAEMCCDWQAMSIELKKNSIREWAEANINKRWKFSPAQIKLIYNIINIFENKEN